MESASDATTTTSAAIAEPKKTPPVAPPSFSYLEASEMAIRLQDSSYVVIDVRDDDYYGGHIPGSMHFPSQTFDINVDRLVSAYADTRKEGSRARNLVFHCMYSQQRGPSCANKFIRRMFQDSSVPEETRPKVWVLSGGYAGWEAGGFPSQ